MMTALYILGFCCALSMIAAPVLIPWLASRYARHEDWIKEAERSRQHLSVTRLRQEASPRQAPRVRVLRKMGGSNV